MQAKLLRVLETGEVQRLGSLRTRQVDVRLVAATNRDLGAAIAAGTFRLDLFYRLNGISLSIPLCASGAKTSWPSPTTSRRR